MTSTIEEVIKIGERLADYVVENSIRNVVFIDKSARQGYIPLNYALRAQHPSVQKPKVYFINPAGCASVRDNQKIAKNRFEKSYPVLYADRKSPVLVFDTCYHTGETLDDVMHLFTGVGFREVHSVVGNFKRVSTDNNPVFHPNRVLLPVAKTCHLFNFEMILKIIGISDPLICRKAIAERDYSLISRVADSDLTPYGIENRRFLHEALSEHYFPEERKIQRKKRKVISKLLTR